MRGGNILFKNIVESEQATKGRKGRNESQNARRNECLSDRYLYYLITTKNRYEAIIEKVADDFFLSHVTVTNILSQSSEGLTKTKKEYAALKPKELQRLLSKKWEGYSWKLDVSDN